MKLFVLFAVFASAYCTANPFEPLNPDDYDDIVWEVIDQMNAEGPHRTNYIIPIKVTFARREREHNITELEVLCGDSNCPMNRRQLEEDVDPKSCQINPNGDRCVYYVKMFANETTSVEYRNIIPRKFLNPYWKIFDFNV